MDRRTFIKSSFGASILAGTGLGVLGKSTLFAGPSPSYDLVAVKGGMPDAMFDRGIAELGGIGAFVKKGQKVCIKPNIGWGVSPERAGNTNPKLVARIIEHCKNAGAKQIVVLDHTCDEWQACYSSSGIESAAKSAGAKVLPAHSESYYHEVSVPRGKTLTTAKEHEAILDADVFINVPVLKNHSGSSLTISMKNLMGNVWDREFWHRNDLHQCIADFATYRKPTLNVVDAYLVMQTNGPRGVSEKDLVLMKTQLLAVNMVVADAAAAKLMSVEPKDIRYIKIAEDMKAGTTDLKSLNIKRITVS